MKITNLAHFSLLPLAKALTIPPISALTQSLLNATTGLPANSNLGRPLGPGIRALENDYFPAWEQGDSITTTESAHLYYNLFVTMVRLWRAPNDTPLITTITTSTARYPEIEIVIVPAATQPLRMTPNLAGALVWQMIQKCTVPDPYYWTADLATRGLPPVEIGLIRAEAQSGNSVALEPDAVSLSGIPQGAITNVTQSLKLTSGTISTDVTFEEALPIDDPWEWWLEAFLEWSSPLLTLKQSLGTVTTDARRTIFRTTYALPNGVNIVMIAKSVNRPREAELLTYDELFQGMQDTLESVIVTNQYRYLRASIYKDDLLAATFSVTVYSPPDLDNAGVSIAVA